jgi:hypothetical protein
MKTTPYGDRSMTLRLVLVGLVAALGISLPGQPGCEQWLESAQRWTMATVATWDTWTPGGAGYECRPSGLGNIDCPQCRIARSRLAAHRPKPATADEHGPVASAAPKTHVTAEPAVAHPTPPATSTGYLASDGFEPMVAQEDPFLQAIWELNRQCDGIEVPPAPPTPRTSAHPTPSVAVVSTPDWEPVTASEDVELSLLGALGNAAGQTWFDATSLHIAAQPARGAERPEHDSVVCNCAGDGWDAGATENATDDVDPDFTAELTGWEFVALSSTDRDSYSVTDCDLEAYIDETPVSLRVAVLPDFPRDVFGAAAAIPQPEPRQVASVRLPVATSPELPRDVFAAPDSVWEPDARSPSPATTSESKPDQTAGRALAEPLLGQAVELTRDALYAWMKVLTGPALVSVTSR